MSHTAETSRTPSIRAKFAIMPMSWLPHIPTLRMLRVFLALAAHADRSGRCFPSIPTISKYTALQTEHVRASLRALEKLGAIQTQQVSGRSSRYQLMPPPPSNLEGGEIQDPPPIQGGVPPSDLEGTPPPDLAPLSNQGTYHLNKPVARAREGAKAPTDEDGFTDEQRAANLARFKAMFTGKTLVRSLP